MKRALADRAKLDLPQSSGANVNGATSPPTEASSTASIPTKPTHENGRIGCVTSPTEGQLPLKLQRISSDEPSSVSRLAMVPPPITASAQLGQEEIPSSSSVPPSPRIAPPRPDHPRSNHTTPSQSSNKRIRRETSSSQSQQLSSEQENDGNSAFYLQHQNRALAIELKSLQAQIQDLTQEREHRRKACLQALQALHSLQATWTSLETALGQDPQPTTLSTAALTLRDMPSSTMGETNETAVEWTEALHRALQALGNQSRRPPGNEHPEDAESPSDANDDIQSSTGQGEMRSLGLMAANITGRANCLQEWLWQVLRAKHVDLPQPDESSGQNRMEVDGELERLKTQATELMQSLDDMSTRERRLRRNIYRLDVGMITQKQLIQSVVAGTDSIDEDPERLAAQKEAVLEGTFGGDGDSVKQENSTDQNAGAEASVSAKVVANLQGELQDCRKEITNREKSIEEVRTYMLWLDSRCFVSYKLIVNNS